MQHVQFFCLDTNVPTVRTLKYAEVTNIPVRMEAPCAFRLLLDSIASAHPRYDHVQKAASAAVVQRNLSHVQLVVSPKTKAQMIALVAQMALSPKQLVILYARNVQLLELNVRMEDSWSILVHGMIRPSPLSTRHRYFIHVSTMLHVYVTATIRVCGATRRKATTVHFAEHAVKKKV